MEKSNSQEYNKAIEYITGLIRCGELSKDSKLPTERVIAEKVGIGRNSTREALSILHGMGMITRKQGSGNYLTGDASGAISQMLTMMLALGTISQSDVCQFRRAIDQSCAKIIIEHGIKSEHAGSMQRAVSEMRRVQGENLSEIDREFHNSLANATGNGLLIAVTDAISPVYGELIDLTLHKANKDKREELIACHDEIYHGIDKCNLEETMLEIDKHYDLIEETL